MAEEERFIYLVTRTGGRTATGLRVVKALVAKVTPKTVTLAPGFGVSFPNRVLHRERHKRFINFTLRDALVSYIAFAEARMSELINDLANAADTLVQFEDLRETARNMLVEHDREEMQVTT